VRVTDLVTVFCLALVIQWGGFSLKEWMECFDIKIKVYMGMSNPNFTSITQSQEYV
jgi:hypothetical protein